MDAVNGTQANWHVKKSFIENFELVIESESVGLVCLESDMSLSEMSESSFVFSFSFKSIATIEPEIMNEDDVNSAYFFVPIVHSIDQNFQNFDENEEEGIPWALKNLINWEEERRAKLLVDEIVSVNVGTEKDHRLVQIGSALSSEEREQLVALLKEFKDVFVWSYEDMSGIDHEIVQHRIPLNPDA